MKNKNHPSETLPIDNSCQTGLPLFSGGVFIMKKIQLSKQGKNKGKYVALVDDEDFEYLNQFRWHVEKIGNTFYALRSIYINGKRTSQLMHGVILGGKGIDHIDHDGLNNQRSNLRFCTQSENNMNMRKRENTSSTYKGVNFQKRNKKWRARIRIDGKQMSLGLFVSEIDAAKAYNTKATEIFGEYANLNELKSNN